MLSDAYLQKESLNLGNILSAGGLMFQSLKEAKQYVKSEKINWIDIKFSDLEGDWRHVTLSVDEHTWYLFDNNGIGFDASSVGLQTLENADMVLKPIWNTGFIDPFAPVKTLSFISTAIDIKSNKPSVLDPRNCLQRAMEFAKKSQICDQAYFAPEYEFYLFESVKYHFNQYESGYTITPQGGHKITDDLKMGVHAGYHRVPPADKHYYFRAKVAEILVSLGIPIHYHHHEVGGSGQGEFEVKLTPILKAGDHAMLIKYVCRNVAAEMGLSVTFMPKPLGNHPGSGMHCHQTLHKNEKNLFFDANGFAGLSKIAENYIAGILKNGRAITGITNPSINSYRRLIPGFEAPTKLFYSPGNRSAAIRIPKYCNTAQEQRIEFRTPDASSNPYLLLASQLMAGIDGVIEGDNPTELGFGPVEGNVFNWSEEKLANLKSLPVDLEHSLNILLENHAFLTRGDVFSEEFFPKWDLLKRNEINTIKGNPHPLEIQMYYNV
jgi:glutamine synthetase